MKVSRLLQRCIPLGGKPGITNTDFFYFIAQYNELPSVKTCHNALLSDHTKWKLETWMTTCWKAGMVFMPFAFVHVCFFISCDQGIMFALFYSFHITCMRSYFKQETEIRSRTWGEDVCECPVSSIHIHYGAELDRFSTDPLSLVLQ